MDIRTKKLEPTVICNNGKTLCSYPPIDQFLKKSTHTHHVYLLWEQLMFPICFCWGQIALFSIFNLLWIWSFNLTGRRQDFGFFSPSSQTSAVMPNTAKKEKLLSEISYLLLFSRRIISSHIISCTPTAFTTFIPTFQSAFTHQENGWMGS